MSYFLHQKMRNKVLISNVKIQMSNQCQSSKWDSEIEDPELVSGQGSERHSCHAEPGPEFNSGSKDFGISFELWI
jgi:hypothetical protein